MSAALSLRMQPAPGDRLVRFVGDRIRFELRATEGAFPSGGAALLRTTLGRGAALRQEILGRRRGVRGTLLSAWHDVPMRLEGGVWVVEITLAEVGFFHAKAYAADARGWQIWPDGPDAGISVHPDSARTGNIIYCAFTRMFGPTRFAETTVDAAREQQFQTLDQEGFTVIPSSGKLRDVQRELDHIFGRLGCQILHLLPVSPTPTMYARMGRYGSPYTVEDLTAIDPALVEFDRRTTGVEQFCELARAVHRRGGRLFLDIVINHTGWGSALQENHPEWFPRGSDGTFASPGAWGVTWEDLVEVDDSKKELWDALAEALLIWCRRGVDGFRCDAGYMVPTPVWQYLIARVREEFPNAIFLLEGLGGSWEATESLLTDGGMQWAYSELFQNFQGVQLGGYLDHSLKQSARAGVLVHYSETHDNDRLAKLGRAWSRLRNQLSALTSVCGGFGFTGGVEWLATEKIQVHECRGMRWGQGENLLTELAQLNALLLNHPCFFDGAQCLRVSPVDHPVYALRRISADGLDEVLVIVNNDINSARMLQLEPELIPSEPRVDWLGHLPPRRLRADSGRTTFEVPPGACYCLAESLTIRGLHGESYRRLRALAAWALECAREIYPMEYIGPCAWVALAEFVQRDPRGFLSSLARVDLDHFRKDALDALQAAAAANSYPNLIVWAQRDQTRCVPVPPGHWLLVEDSAPFCARLEFKANGPIVRRNSVRTEKHSCAAFPPADFASDAVLVIERYGDGPHELRGTVRFLGAEPQVKTVFTTPEEVAALLHPELSPELNSPLVLLTNGRGGMARLAVDLGHIKSKYDCLLAANLHSKVPVDRHVLAKRVRLWGNADGFVTALNGDALAGFECGKVCRWNFQAPAGDGRQIEVQLAARMVEEQNTVILTLTRGATSLGTDGANTTLRLSLTVRVDIEDRNFHSQTQRNGGAEFHFRSHTQPLPDGPGFRFQPAPDRCLRVAVDHGAYYPAEEWSLGLPHSIEQSRGMVGTGDAFSPGWFEIPLEPGANATLTISAEPPETTQTNAVVASKAATESTPDQRSFEQTLLHAVQAFVVRRAPGKTVIAGYPWFLDWGRDTLICVRGLIAAGLNDTVRDILLTFARFEQNGTLPNSINGEDASNRDTSDAPLWFGIACEEFVAPLTANQQADFYQCKVDGVRTMAEVLRSIATGYLRGTANGIRTDPATSLVWSPPHFTWMDTNFPAGTPRQGYPVEIQVLWIRLLEQLDRLRVPAEGESWSTLAQRVRSSLREFFWLPEQGYLADVLLAEPGQSARHAVRDTALRSNSLFAVSLGLITGPEAQSCVALARDFLVVPGALRTLAPLPVQPPLALYTSDGRLLNNPNEPYWGRYEGDEDTRRKPAYHNGTAWTWTFPSFCEALARAWNFEPSAVAAARAYLGSMSHLVNTGCLGHLPEIVDGDAPHQERGCDAQAWGATEALRVWKILARETRSTQAVRS